MVDMVFLADVPPEQFDADTSPRDLALGFLEMTIPVAVPRNIGPRS